MDKTRAAIVEGLADTGATFSSIPSEVARRLGLTFTGEVPVILTTGQEVILTMFAGILEVGGRETGTSFSATERGLVAIGVTDLEKLGLKVNPSTGQLEPTAILG